MRDKNSLEALRDQARSHDLRLRILALVNQGKGVDPENLRQELPDRPSVAVIKYHLFVLRQAELLPE